MLVYDIAAKLFRVFSKYGRSLWTRLEKCCMNTVYTTKPQNTNKVYRTNQVYLITPKCKSSLNNDTGIQTVKKLCDVNTSSPVLLIHHCLAQTTNVTMVGQYHLSLSHHSSILCHCIVQAATSCSFLDYWYGDHMLLIFSHTKYERVPVN